MLKLSGSIGLSQPKVLAYPSHALFLPVRFPLSVRVTLSELVHPLCLVISFG